MMNVRRLGGVALSGVLAWALGIASVNAAELPDGPNRDLVARECTACHDLEMLFAAAGASREDWSGAIDEMSEYGLKVSPEQRAQILDYLATYLGPGSKAAAKR